MSLISVMQERSFSNTGFSIVDDFFREDELNKLNKEVSAILSGLKNGKHTTVSDGLIHNEPRIKSLFTNVGLLAQSRSKLSNVILDQVVMKRPFRDDLPGPWHQDSVLIPGTKVCTLYLALAEYPSEPLELIPRSHTLGALLHVNDEIGRDKMLSLAGAIRPKLNFGSAIIIHPNLVHRGLPNDSENIVITYSIVF